ncbi:hypothetical protein B0H17DRAFT_866779, partial [Mycena rosella]
FFVLDEAQFAADGLPTAFHPDPGASPILVEILNIWDSHHSIGSASFVVAGTEIPFKIFEEPNVAEHLGWTSDTGAFDEKSLQENYPHRFLPPSFSGSTSDEEFMCRAWHWTRGRHRYTAALVENLIVSGFQSPHRF